jgi:hypothetical protein
VEKLNDLSGAGADRQARDQRVPARAPGRRKKAQAGAAAGAAVAVAVEERRLLDLLA